LPIINLVRSAEMPDAVGYALPDYEVVVLDDQFNILPPDTNGHLAIKGPGMFDAYLVPKRTRDEVLQNGYFLTADYGSITEDGLIRVQGRLKSVINVSGSKVFPEEVEAVLQTIPEIKQARISSAPHSLLGHVIQAEVVLNEGQVIDEEEVLTYCRKRLSTFKIPQKLTIVESLQMTGSGKMQRF
jgi:acyl-coenzyme A synthetase/AMP-(fatty) acid ligase